jgi:4-amino-4-deoxy-L-arabinose transferase
MTKIAPLIVITFFLLVYIVPLGVRPIMIPDEARYSEIPREMLVSGDWVVPHLDGMRYFEKPPLGYWLNCISMSVFGENAFAVRLPSAIAAGISAICIFLLVRRYTGKDFAGILAATVLLSCLLFFIVSTTNILDSVFSACVTAALTSFFFAYTEQHTQKKLLLLTICGVFCGLSFLAKGFLAFALPVVIIAPFALWERRLWQTLKGNSIVPLIVAAVVALPWCIMIHRREPDFWNYFFWTEHIKRFMSAEAQHSSPFWFYIPIFIGGTMPWTVVLPAVAKWVRSRGINDSLFRFCICWLVFCFLFFSASKGKLPTYILPCLPPFAVIVTLGLLRYLELETKARRDFSGAAWVSAIIAGGFVIALATNQITGLPERLYGKGELWSCGLALAAFVAWGVFSVLAARATDVCRKLVFYCFAPVLVLFCIPFIMPDKLKEGKAPGNFLLANISRVGPDDILIADGSMVHAVCWFYKRNDVFVLTAGELEYGLGYADSSHRLVPLHTLGEFIKNTKKGRVILIAKDKQHIREQLPDSIFTDAREKFIFAEFSPPASAEK